MTARNSLIRSAEAEERAETGGLSDERAEEIREGITVTECLERGGEILENLVSVKAKVNQISETDFSKNGQSSSVPHSTR